MVYPQTSTLGTLRERVPLGRTPLSPKEVFEVLEKMRSELPGPDYNVLRSNCAHFSVRFVQLLRVTDAPPWVNSLANVGEALVSQLGLAGAEAAADAATPRPEDRVPPRLATFSDDEDDLEDKAADGDELALRELAWRRSQTYVYKKAADAERDARFVDLTLELKWKQLPDNPQVTPQAVNWVLRDDRLWQVLAEAAATGFCLISKRRWKKGGRYFEASESESDEEELDDDKEEVNGKCRNLEVKHVQRSQNNVITVSLRLRGKALDEKGREPQWDTSKFKAGLKFSVGPARGLTGSWPETAIQLVAGLEVLTAPDQALFGQRIETASGRYGGKVLHGPPVSAASAQRRLPLREPQQDLPLPDWKGQPPQASGRAWTASPQYDIVHAIEPVNTQTVQESLNRLQKVQRLRQLQLQGSQNRAKLTSSSGYS
eukprot:TRINITY_DN94224_c0_g1_i1.p1 TRINITY_DN94224_c0_g1~~TRINITY_DN94224_c0_g1_i1.p1  ORF type:complete len:430 (+),score=68.36 TRINITY_DN94224_c0_g1_i1:317-1606(+)